jgi:hypothetical protein
MEKKSPDLKIEAARQMLVTIEQISQAAIDQNVNNDQMLEELEALRGTVIKKDIRPEEITLQAMAAYWENKHSLCTPERAHIGGKLANLAFDYGFTIKVPLETLQEQWNTSRKNAKKSLEQTRKAA